MPFRTNTSKVTRARGPSTGFVAIKAATLDDPNWLRPTAHFWSKSAQAWANHLGNLGEG